MNLNRVLKRQMQIAVKPFKIFNIFNHHEAQIKTSLIFHLITIRWLRAKPHKKTNMGVGVMKWEHLFTTCECANWYVDMEIIMIARNL